MQWYVSQNGRTSGPFTDQRIAMLVNWGKISSEAYICDDKWSCWVAVTRSHFAPLMAARGVPLPPLDSQVPRALSEPPGGHGWLGHRLALALLIMLAAAAFLLALWLAPEAGTPGPLGNFWTNNGATELSSGASPRLPHTSALDPSRLARRAHQG
jgi:hypothetical protein